jgi:hypothetical protein
MFYFFPLIKEHETRASAGGQGDNFTGEAFQEWEEIQGTQSLCDRQQTGCLSPRFTRLPVLLFLLSHEQIPHASQQTNTNAAEEQIS